MTLGRRGKPDRSESFGEGLLGTILDRAHELPPHRVGLVVAETVSRLGAGVRRSCSRTTGNRGWFPYSPKG